jgi:hypothetical protein
MQSSTVNTVVKDVNFYRCMAWHGWMSCITSSVCWLGFLIIGGFLTLTVYLCHCIWKCSDLSVKGFASPMISSTGSYSWQLFKVCIAYVTCGLMDLVYEMCSLYLVFYILWAGTAQWV